MEAQNEKFLTIEEYENALRYITNITHRTQFLLMGDAGLRVTEVCTLRWTNIDVRKKLVSVDSLKKRDKEKPRRIPMSERLYDSFVQLVAKKGKTAGYIFGHGDGPQAKPITRHAISKWMRELSDEHPDLPHLHPHLLRHTFATNLRVQGAEIADIQNALGHEKVDTTMIYAHADREKLRLLIEASAPRPTRLQRISRRLFPKRPQTINLPAAIIPDLVGRDARGRCQTGVLDALRIKVSKESVPNLCKLLAMACDRKTVILKIGEIDSVTPSVVRALEMLKEHFIILTTSRAVKMSAGSFLWDFEKLELKPLPRVDSLRLFHRLTDDLQLSELAWIQNKIYDTSEGNPRMIGELAERIRREPVIDTYVVDELCNSYLGRQTHEIDVSPILLLLFGGLIVLKYIGRETGEQGLTFVGSAIMVVAMFGRYFFRGAKRRSL